MAKIVNLKRVRKAAAKKDERRQASENAARFGRSKSQKHAEKEQQSKDAHHLDGHFLGDG